MTFWFILAAMTGAAVMAALWPLSWRMPPEPAASSDVTFYRDQLAEIRRDEERGLLSPGEAEAARVEAGRRLLRATAALDRPSASMGEPALRRRRAASAFALSIVPLVALATYGAVGSPRLPGQPLSARLQADPQTLDIATAVARIEVHLAGHPDDQKGWDLIGPVYLRAGRFDDAARAFSTALRLGGDTVDRLTGYGDALTGGNDGIVPAEARGVFDRALKLDPANVKSRFYLALAAQQEGDSATARAQYEAVVWASPPNAPWLALVRDKLAKLDGDDAATLASDQPEPDIKAMVEGLDARLAEGGGTPDQWARLIRSYVVLGQRDKAAVTLGRAKRSLADNSDGLVRIEGVARDLGVAAAGAAR